MRDDYELSPVKFSRVSRRGILLGLTAPQLVTASLAVAIIIGALYFGGGEALTWLSPAWASVIALTWVPIGGRRAVEWIPVTSHWAARVAAKQTTFRKRLTKPRPAGTLALPGDAASLRMHLDPDTEAVMVHDPHSATLTALLEVSHPAFILLDPGEQERRVHAWGRVLATTCRSNHIARLQVLERTLPDSGTGLSEWWSQHGHNDGSWVAGIYQELIDRAGPAGERHVTTISLALDMRAASRAIRSAGGGIKGAAAVLRQEMTTLTSALRTADLRPSRWYGPGQLAIMLRSAYDPQVASTLDRSGNLGHDLATAGPVAVDERWDKIRTDSAHHAVLWVSDWPRSQIYPGFLAPLLLSSGIRRSFTLLCDPVRSDQAARSIRKLRTEYVSDAAQRAKAGQIEDAQQSAEYQDVLRQESDMISGHGVLRYTGLITISANTEAELDSAIAATQQAAIQASLETRLLVGQQASAFTAAALPLCRGI
ncbi:SCO6880 family protein [Microbacterium sp. JB110]|uniref:SCO6880 family protein n=1 Tax=Microbacterium sp. JB110 TaxID=2024477 RepID=UPI00097F1A16|nr:SCO6880 family protein [Microbacterium sp. JB110]RCS57178.1 PrgI family protein [Microbacterium sp. JB110]SJM57407.1 membrane protein [Frigoribacterium sp. JB110]